MKKTLAGIIAAIAVAGASTTCALTVNPAPSTNSVTYASSSTL